MAQPFPQSQKKWSAGLNEALLLLLYIAVSVSIVFKIGKARLAILVLSFAFLGLTMKPPVSMANIAALCMGHIHDIHDNLFWWMLVSGSLIIVLIFGKNVYCSWLCPFGAVLEFIAKAGGMGFTLPKKLQPVLKTATKGLVVVLFIVAFTTGNETNSSVELFSVLFSFKGATFQWYLVPLAICGSFLITRFWRRFLCPVRVCYNSVVRVQSSIKRGLVKQSCPRGKCSIPCKQDSNNITTQLIVI